MRRLVPESPRWLVTHGRIQEADATIADIEHRAAPQGGLPRAEGVLTIHPRKSFGFGLIFGAMLGKYRGRSALALTLMVGQAFLFNAVFFTYGLVLQHYEHVPDADIGLYILPLCLGNLVGPFALGHLFDTIGRRRMICFTYAASGLLLMAMAVLFGEGMLTATTQTIALGGGVLLRLRCCQFSLPHRQRNLPARNPRFGDRGVLCARHGDWRGGGRLGCSGI